MRTVLKVFVLSTLMAWGDYVHAQAPAPFPDFDAKRLKPPASDAKKRITIQIEERANPAVAPPLPIATDDKETDTEEDTATGAVTPVALYDWFWRDIVAQPTQLRAGRLQDALEVVSRPANRATLPPPRLQDMQDIVRAYGRDILLASLTSGISPALVLAVIYTESGGRPEAVSKAGAVGLMQLIPATSARFDVADPLVPSENIKGGTTFLSGLIERYEGDPILALAAYNAGEGAVAEHSGVPPFVETRNYVPRVISAYAVARGMCTTQPLLATDPCVFAAIAE